MENNRCEQWNTKASILKDLCRITNGDVDIDFEKTVVGSNAPATLADEELNMEYTLASDFVIEPPDLNTISQMLEMVNNINLKDNDDECPTENLVPVTEVPSLRKKKTSIPPKQRCNVTVEESSLIKDDEPVKLMTPDDFLISPQHTDLQNEAVDKKSESITKYIDWLNSGIEMDEIQESTYKVSDWISRSQKYFPSPKEKIEEKLIPAKPSPNNGVTLMNIKVPENLNADNDTKSSSTRYLSSPNRMFKEKVMIDKTSPVNSKNTINISESNKCTATNIGDETDVSSQSNNIISSKVGSTHTTQFISQEAEGFYNKLLELSKKRKESSQSSNDVTARAILKSDEPKLIKPHVTETVLINLGNGVEKSFPSQACLPLHRHRLTENCIVCKVMCVTQEK